MYRFYTSPQTLEEALELKAHYGEDARIIAGGTDLLIELDRGLRKTAAGEAIGLIDLTRVPGLASIWEEDDTLHLGPLVTHNQCLVDPLVLEKAFPLARACWDLASPQIRNRGTVAGNLVTASPANDLIVPLVAQDARLTLRSRETTRTVKAIDFFLDFRKVDLHPDEILVEIAIPALPPSAEGVFIKLGLRRAQAISVVSVAINLHFETASHSPHDGRVIGRAAIALGAVAPTIIRAPQAEAYLQGKTLSRAIIDEAAKLAAQACRPIDDVRGSAEYRRAMVAALTARGLRQIERGQARAGLAEQPVMLWGETRGVWPVVPPLSGQAGDGTIPDPVETQRPHAQADAPDAPAAPEDAPDGVGMINGQPQTLPGAMTLLDSLRAAGILGVKEGCAEGECGSCTVFLDGMAVMACLVPAERAYGSRVVTVEGLGAPGQLHPIQQALVDSGGVQCGYCTPGFVMSGAKLLEEQPRPTRTQAQEALTGNLCRCTGYRKILDAVVAAGHLSDRSQSADPAQPDRAPTTQSDTKDAPKESAKEATETIQ